MSSFFSSISSAFSDFLPTVYAEEPAATEDEPEPEATDESKDAPEPKEDEEEEEEEEPEDTAPGIREACEAKPCKSFKHHFEECAERVQSGKTQLEGENCVEELFHLMHCVDECAAAKVFATLK